MEFKPTKDEVLQAWEDLESGKPISKEMQDFLEQLEERERQNAANAEVTARWVQREERTNHLVDVWSQLYKQARKQPMPDDAREELRRDLRKST